MFLASKTWFLTLKLHHPRLPIPRYGRNWVAHPGIGMAAVRPRLHCNHSACGTKLRTLRQYSSLGVSL